ncbi:MAG: hypothetical protein RL077_1993 [Verrucomicrobiota bacterium]|jgi:uncharacterized membrane protein
MSTLGLLFSSNRIFKSASKRDLGVLLAVAWFVPFAVHLAPWSGPLPLGAHLIPMFWTTLVAAYFFGPRVGALTGIFAPAINLLATGLPAWKFLGGLSFELVGFAVLVAWLMPRFPQAFWVAPLAFTAMAFLAAGLPALVSVDVAIRPALASWLSSMAEATAGLGVLTVINAVLIGFYPKTP